LITDARSAAADLDAATPVCASLGWRAWLLILSITITVCCFGLSDARTLTEHEIFVAGGAKQMALDHDWLFPKIGDHPWLEKPPLLHWLVIVSAKLLGGFFETAVRLPSVLAGLGVVIVMTLLGLRWFGARVAIFTALLHTTTVYFITYARLAETEMLLAFIVILALFVFVRLHSIGGVWPRDEARSRA
jgi:4-amino-4-deoxy-L-arabinose transferase-like glycosyltransferase